MILLIRSSEDQIGKTFAGGSWWAKAKRIRLDGCLRLRVHHRAGVFIDEEHRCGRRTGHTTETINIGGQTQGPFGA